MATKNAIRKSEAKEKAKSKPRPDPTVPLKANHLTAKGMDTDQKIDRETVRRNSPFQPLS